MSKVGEVGLWKKTASGWPGAIWTGGLNLYHTPHTELNKTLPSIPNRALSMNTNEDINIERKAKKRIMFYKEMKPEELCLDMKCISLFSETHKEKNTLQSNTAGLHPAVGLLCCLWHWRPWMHQKDDSITILAFHSKVCYPVSQNLGWGEGLRSFSSTMNHSGTIKWLKGKRWAVLNWPAVSPDLRKLKMGFSDL